MLHQSRSAWALISTAGSCSHRQSRGEWVLHDPYMFNATPLPHQWSILTHDIQMPQLRWKHKLGPAFSLWSDALVCTQHHFCSWSDTSFQAYGLLFVSTGGSQSISHFIDLPCLRLRKMSLCKGEGLIMIIMTNTGVNMQLKLFWSDFLIVCYAIPITYCLHSILFLCTHFFLAFSVFVIFLPSPIY